MCRRHDGKGTSCGVGRSVYCGTCCPVPVRRLLVTALVAMVSLSGVVSSPISTAAAAANDEIIEYPVPTANSQPWGITSGPDGALWFAEYSTGKVGRMAPNGDVTEYTPPTASSGVHYIAAGSDSHLWFPEESANKIGRISVAGTIDEFAVPTGASGAFGIAAGPDHNVWFTERTADKIGRITAAGGITEFPTPLGSPMGIIASSDGNMWFTEGAYIGRITTQGVITDFPVPNHGSPIGPEIAASPDGSLWYTEFYDNRVARMTPAGVVTEYMLPAGQGQPLGITATSDGNVWFTVQEGAFYAPTIDRVSPTGTISVFSGPVGCGGTTDVALGGDGNLWFTLGCPAAAIGRLRLSSLPNPCGGVQSPPAVAVFVDGIGSELPYEDYDATNADYAGVASGQQQAPATVAWIRQRFTVAAVHPGGGSQSIDQRLANQGDALMPFSYQGAYLYCDASTGLIRARINNYSAVDVDRLEIASAAASLGEQVASIHQVWPTSRVVVIGHSHGGLVSGTYFASLHDVPPWYLAGVFALDAPLNGVLASGYCEDLATKSHYPVGNACRQYGALYWEHVIKSAKANDALLLAADSTGRFTPVGTHSDLLYQTADIGSGLQSQLLYRQGSTVTPPDYQGQDWTWSLPTNPLDTHSYVMGEPVMVNKAAAAAAGTAPPTPASLAVPSAQPEGQLPSTAVSVGQVITLNGSGFGATTGQVLFSSASGQDLQASVQSWSSTQVMFAVPNGARTGRVVLVTAAGIPTNLGRVTILPAPNNVTAIDQVGNAPAYQGEIEPVTLRVTNSIGNPVAGAEVALSDGSDVVSGISGSTGAVTLEVIGNHTEPYVAYSGAVWKNLTLNWIDAPIQSLSMTANPASPGAGDNVAVQAILRDQANNPVPGATVNFSSAGGANTVLSQAAVATDVNGVAVTHVLNPGAGPVVIQVTANHLEATAQLVVNWAMPSPVVRSAASTQQYQLSNSNGTSWAVMDATNLTKSVSPAVDSSAILDAGADLFTGNSGYNQDLGIFVSDNGGPDQLVAWKESGGFAGTFSPNAAFVHSVFAMTGGHTYLFKLKWKTNKNAPGATIYAGAGPIGGAFSPTRLTAEVLPNITPPQQ